jgi:hypothetical protein
MNIFALSEFESLKRDAYSSEGKTPAERIAMFIGLMDMVEAIQNNFSVEERVRRMNIAEKLDSRPDPWWRNFRKEALEEYARTHEADQKDFDRLIREHSHEIKEGS